MSELNPYCGICHGTGLEVVNGKSLPCKCIDENDELHYPSVPQLKKALAGPPRAEPPTDHEGTWAGMEEAGSHPSTPLTKAIRDAAPICTCGKENGGYEVEHSSGCPKRPSAPAPSGEPLEDAAWWKAECLRVVALLRAKCSDDEWVRLGGMLPMRRAEAVESSPLDLKDAARLAQFFHETYERLALISAMKPARNRQSRGTMSEKNRNLMIAVCRKALAAFAAAVREGR